MTVIFNGKRWAQTEEELLINQVRELKENYNLAPCLATVLVGDNPASRLYVNLKKRASERLGCRLDLLYFEKISAQELISQVKTLNQNPEIHGIMVQLPLPKDLAPFKSRILNSISFAKDVDGLRENSPYLHPTAKAVLKILEEATDLSQDNSIAVVGARGMVGAPLVKKLDSLGYRNIIKLNSDSSLSELKKADVIVSATGHPALINGTHLKKGIIAIDVGSPRGDFDFNSVKSKARFLTPVPGGVGPVTICCLLENLLSACQSQLSG